MYIYIYIYTYVYIYTYTYIHIYIYIVRLIVIMLPVDHKEIVGGAKQLCSAIQKPCTPWRVHYLRACLDPSG